jgi:hypothetical protein
VGLSSARRGLAAGVQARGELTVRDILSAQDLVLALDIRVKVLDKVEMVRHALPGNQVVDTVLVPDVAFASDVGQWLYVCVDRSQQQPKV